MHVEECGTTLGPMSAKFGVSPHYKFCALLPRDVAPATELWQHFADASVEPEAASSRLGATHHESPASVHSHDVARDLVWGLLTRSVGKRARRHAIARSA
jgi:hypothetical protein